MTVTTTTNTTLPKASLLVVGGRVLPFLKAIAVTPEDVSKIWQHLEQTVHPIDFIVLFVVAFSTVPLLSVIYRIFLPGKPYKESYVYLIADHISQAAKIAMAIFLVDCLTIILHTLGFAFSHLSQMSQGIAKILYILWAASRISVFKRYLLSQAVSKSPDKLGRLTTVDRIADGVLALLAGFFLLDILDVEMGIGVTSVFAFGSAGTLVIGLATQSIASMFVSGIALSTSDRIREGDYIQFGDGTSGQVIKMGWMQTTLRNYDDLVEVIPNSDLGNQRVKNLSRVKKCRLRQKLRFRYEDAEKLKTLLPDIIEEIKKDCESVIADGSSPLRAVWTDYEADHLQILVEAHFNLPPFGTAFHTNRQTFNFAIYNAVRKHGVQFVTDFYPTSLN